MTSAIDASWLGASEKAALLKQFRGTSVWTERGGGR
jgi:hypothetical protein